MTTTMSSQSVEYYRATVAATLLGVPYNPTTDVVAFAFTTGTSQPSTWTAGVWESYGGQYFAKILLGPGASLTLTPGTYTVWVKITDNPEIPVKSVGTLIVT